MPVGPYGRLHEKEDLRHLGASLMPMTYPVNLLRDCAPDTLCIHYGAPMCKRLMKAMGRRTVEPHCGIRVIRKVMVLRRYVVLVKQINKDQYNAFWGDQRSERDSGPCMCKIAPGYLQ